MNFYNITNKLKIIDFRAYWVGHCRHRLRLRQKHSVLWMTLGQSFHSEREKDYWNYEEIKEILLDASKETNSLCTIEGPHFSVVPGKK